MKKRVIFLFSAIIFYCSLQNANAKTCIAGDLKVSTVSGIVVLANETIFNNIPIKLSKDVTGNYLIKQVTTDENGEFSFGELKSGKYFVIVQNTENLNNLTFRVKVKKKHAEKHPSTESPKSETGKTIETKQSPVKTEASGRQYFLGSRSGCYYLTYSGIRNIARK